MSFERPQEVTKTEKKSAKKEPSAKSLASSAYEKTVLEKPGTELTLSTKREMPARSSEKERVSIPPQSEKEEFFERLGKYDEPEDEDIEKLREEIKVQPEIPTKHFLEKETSDEQKQERFLEDLIINLKEKIGADIDRDEANEIIEDDKNIYDKIKTLLVISRAKKIENLQTRKDIFEQIHDFLDAKYKKDRRQILNELADTDVSQEEKNRLAAQILNPLEQNYRTKLADFKDEYLGLNLRLTKKEVNELQTLSDKQMEINKVRELGEEVEDLTDEEYEKLKKLSEKSRIIKELEEI